MQKIIDEAKREPKSSDIIYRELRGLLGRAQQEAFDRLGYPDRKLQVEQRTVYSWERIEPDDLRCTVKVIVAGGRVVDTDFHGNNGACSYFARRLDPTYTKNY